MRAPGTVVSRSTSPCIARQPAQHVADFATETTPREGEPQCRHPAPDSLTTDHAMLRPGTEQTACRTKERALPRSTCADAAYGRLLTPRLRVKLARAQTQSLTCYELPSQPARCSPHATSRRPEQQPLPVRPRSPRRSSCSPTAARPATARRAPATARRRRLSTPSRETST